MIFLRPHKHGLALGFVLGALAVTTPQAAEIFEKVGTPAPISPTGLASVFPATARGAGWTMVAEESRLGMAGSNPAFIAGNARTEVSLGTTWTHREDESSIVTLVSDVVRFDAALAAVRIAPVWLAFGYQNPDHSELDLQIFRNSATRLEENLDVWLLAIAYEPWSRWRVGGSVALLDKESGTSRLAYQASLGAVVEAGRATVAAAFKSEPFGQDRTEMLAPALVQVDARWALTPGWAIAGRFGAGWWNNTRHGRLQSPVDVGVGASWQAISALRLFAGVHHLSERSDCSAHEDVCVLVLRDQGTFLDGGLQLRLDPVQLALSVEDNHVNGTGSTTAVSLSLRAAY